MKTALFHAPLLERMIPWQTSRALPQMPPSSPKGPSILGSLPSPRLPVLSRNGAWGWGAMFLEESIDIKLWISLLSILKHIFLQQHKQWKRITLTQTFLKYKQNVCACVGMGFHVHMYACMWGGQKLNTGCFSQLLSNLFFETGTQDLTRWADQQAPGFSPVCASLSFGYRWATLPGLLQGCGGFKPRSSCLPSKHFNSRAVSQAPKLEFLKLYESSFLREEGDSLLSCSCHSCLLFKP